MNWEKEFNEIYRRATGEENIVGDLLVKQFIQNLLDKQREEIKEKIEKKLLKKIDKWTKRNKIKTTYYMDSELKDDIFKELNK